MSLPNSLFNSPKSLVLYDKTGNLLSANVASDEQWRFPKIDSVSYKLKKSITLYEDEYFYIHSGFNPISIFKSLILNIKSNDTKRGGSTITMQTIRLLHSNPPRTYFQKLKEIILAIRFELFNSKKIILEYYVSNAPYGGNIVGVETASWRYYNKSSFELSWAEAATMAVLPNQPSYIYPGKNQTLLIKKRNKLLLKLKNKKIITPMEYNLSLMEELPSKFYSIPNKAYHLSQSIKNGQNKGIFHTTISSSIQSKVTEIISKYHNTYKQGHINNIAAVVIDANTSEIISYIGNVNDTVSGNKINMIERPRSSGSTLKPLLYAAMINDGYISSESLLKDIPMDINGYEPSNNSNNFDGLVKANEALTRSLNIPWILGLKDYGYEKYYDMLQKYGYKHFDKPAHHYGLSLVVGGGEIELIELANQFLLLSNKLKGINENQISNYINDKPKYSNYTPQLSKGSIWLTFEALSNVTRPENEQNWQYRQSQKLAWKTGTSHGYRDAWAVGVNSHYVIAVWVGNAEGNGRNVLTGIKKAAPILFDILNILPKKTNHWYTKPKDELKKIKICKQSGYSPNKYCKDIVLTDYPKSSELYTKCPYHTKIFVDENMKFQVNNNCYDIDKIKTISWFKLPIVEQTFYKKVNPLFKSSPPFHPDCISTDSRSMDIVFPKVNTIITMPSTTMINEIVLQAIHRQDSAKIHWFVDNKFIATTITDHKVSIDLPSGYHSMTIQDNFGNFLYRRFKVINE